MAVQLEIYMTKTEAIINKIVQQIKQGSLMPGDRIPSVRAMSRLEAVSTSTVVEAYMDLENSGFIEAKPQSGFYVHSSLKYPLETSIPATLSLNRIVPKMDDLITAILCAGRADITMPLGAACPSPDLLPWKQLNRLQSAVVRENPIQSCKYDFPPGWEPLRHQIARYHTLADCRLTASDIIITAGCMEAVFLALRAAVPFSGTVLVESPTYFGILQAIESLGLKVIEVVSHPYEGINPKEVHKIIKNHRIDAAIFMPNFSNPSGALTGDDAKRQLVELFTQEQIPLIEDDLYGDLTFSYQRPRMFKSFDQHGWVITCSSFSKTLAPGLRLGWIAPGLFYKKVLSLKISQSFASASLPSHVVAKYLTNGGYERHLRRLRRTLALQAQKYLQAIHLYFPKGTKVNTPQGGMSLWIELPSSIDAIELQDICLQKHITIAPGVIFSASRQYRHYIRINYAVTWSKNIQKALKTIGDICNTLNK